LADRGISPGVAVEDRRVPKRPSEHNGLIAADTAQFVHGLGVMTPVLGVGLSANDEEGAGGVQGKEPSEVHVAPVHDVERAGFRPQDVEHVDVVQLAVGDVDESLDVAAQIQQGVPLDRRLSGSKQRPREDRQTQIDGGGIQGIDDIVEAQSQVLVGRERLSDADQGVGKVGIHPPVAPFVGFG